MNRALSSPPFLTHCICRCHPPGSFTDPSAESLSRERARERDRSRPHERRHHSSAGEKQRYYSCERYSSREQSHTKSAGPSRSTSPGESHDSALLKQVRCLPFFCSMTNRSMSPAPVIIFLKKGKIGWHLAFIGACPLTSMSRNCYYAFCVSSATLSSSSPRCLWLLHGTVQLEATIAKRDLTLLWFISATSHDNDDGLCVVGRGTPTRGGPGTAHGRSYPYGLSSRHNIVTCVKHCYGRNF